MNTNPVLDPCAPDVSCATPYEFVRLRYFFGQRLGVLELTDEQAYVVGKFRFHNQHLHGAGVLCGLRGERYAPTDQEATTILKVTRGAAIDGCGREILVGWDSCIDVAAWVRRQRAENPDLADTGWTDDPRIWIVVCYQECPSDPAPAAHDPCGCEPTGCEHSRVREGFRLDLVTESDLPEPHHAQAAPEVCPDPPANPCLVLARVDLTLDDDGEVIDLHAIDNAIEARVELWSTTSIQALLSTVIDASDISAALAGGPKFGPIAFEAGTSNNDGTLLLPVLLTENEAGDPSPILGDPTQAIEFNVRRVKEQVWEDVDPVPETAWNETESRFELAFDEGLEPGRYRLTASISLETPIVDSAFRELFPRTLTRWFHLEEKEEGVLTLVEPST